ncbi:SRPBCC family protein [Flavobacterium sp. '19STA2R22 D10 B1']|uniref:SRPBCC family protein n=1 Tax=Flavobacterium aerium TaxID=3037261 RepID=UPI00278BB9B4|nr:SRPBCC domain-containing protein [Flavobacterium sp. '19STA2R22 D10 B1']
MENFNWTSFTVRIAINAPISKLYDAWTKATEIEKWFLSNANFLDSNNQLQPKEKSIEKGFHYEWSWYLYSELERGTITGTNPSDFIQFTFAGDCIVEVKLTDHKDYVLVELTQRNIPTDDNSKKNIRLGCHDGWSFYLVNLKSVYEGGLDLRNKNINLKPMLNN